MHLDPILPTVVFVVLLILVVSLVLKILRQPHVVGYLLAGVLLGPHALGIVKDVDLIHRLGALGVVLLLFFVGMEISPQRLAASWKITLIGTLLQVAVTVALVALLGVALDWPFPRILLIGFAVSLSSTAVILKLLKDGRKLESRTGQNVLGILLVQDIAIVPMLVAIGFLTGSSLSVKELFYQVLGAIILLGLVLWVVTKKSVRLPFGAALRKDPELQIFGALTICLGLAVLSGALYLSTALGAFVGGILVGSTRETSWFHESLEPFRVLFVALFFVSVGMAIDLDFLRTHFWQIALLVLIVLVTNTLVNAGILRVLGESGRDSLYAGAMLAQVGEFSFLLVTVGLQSHIISDFAYQLAVAVIAITLVLSPAWISLFHRLTGGEASLEPR